MPRTRTPAAVAIPLLVAAALTATIAAAVQDDAEAPSGWGLYVAPVLARGGTGRAFFPSVGGTQVLDPRGLAVHMTRADDPGEEIVQPAGVPFVPPPGRFRVWLQGEDRITPFSHLIVFANASTDGVVAPSTLAAPGPGGWVHAPAAVDGDEAGTHLWLLHAADDETRYELSRRRPLAEAREGVLMPAGRTLAALWDAGDERWVALGRPFDVPAGRRVTAPVGRPAPGAAHLVAFAFRPHEVVRVPLAGVVPTVAQGGRERPADLTIADAWGVYGVWYDLAAGPALLGGGNGELYVEPRTLELPAGGVERLEAPLLGRPLLDVGLVLPPEAREKPMTLAVRALPAGDELASAELPRTAGNRRFRAGLVATPAEVVLTTHLGVFRRRVELAAGEETFVGLEPELIELSGTVRRGGEPHAATVRFTTVAGDAVEAAAGEDGLYRAVALQALGWVEVDLEGVDQEPWQDFFLPPIRSGRELDFDLSDAEVTVRVVDALSGRRLGGAVVGVRSVYAPPAAEGGDEERPARDRGRALGRSHTADAEGVVRLPPPRPGRLEIHASADGYRPLPEPEVVEIADPPRDHAMEIALEPAGATVEVRLTLPGGAPAAGAEVLRVDGSAAGTTLFSGRADEAGVVGVPVEPRGGLLLLRHPAAASAVVEWPRWADEERVEHALPAAAETPLTLRVLDPSGEVPARGAGLTLWVDGRRLSGPHLAWLLDARPLADGAGAWISHRLPRRPLRILAWSRELHAEAEAGGLDSLATELPYPWPPAVELRAVR